MAKTPVTAAKSVTILVEGDSWEHLPDWGAKALPIVGGTNYDMSRALADLGHQIYNIAYWGDTIQGIVDADEYMRQLVAKKPTHMLLGGGGNDMLGDGRLQTFLRLYDKDRKTEDYLKPGFDDALDAIFENYTKILARMARSGFGDVKVFVHGYDYSEPMALGWIGQPMEIMGIDRVGHLQLQRDIVRLMIDQFNKRMGAMARAWPNVTYIDFRGMVGKRWHDELHPNKDAFKDLAAKMAASF